MILCFSVIFTKGNLFVLLLLDNVALSKKGLLLKERICS